MAKVSQESSALIYILLQVPYLHFQLLRRSYLRTVIVYAWDMVTNGPPSPCCKSEMKMTKIRAHSLHVCSGHAVLLVMLTASLVEASVGAGGLQVRYVKLPPPRVTGQPVPAL